jgi:hypothetical protein
MTLKTYPLALEHERSFKDLGLPSILLKEARKFAIRNSMKISENRSRLICCPRCLKAHLIT